MKGLIVKPYWADKILYEGKTVEVRGSNTSIRGEIGIIKSGSKHIYGTANLYDCMPIGKEEFEGLLSHYHKIDMSYEELLKVYPKPHAWFLKDIKAFETPVPYEHKRGCVIWVNI